MPPDPDVRRYLDALAAAALPPIWELTHEQARANARAAASGLFGESDAVGSVVDQVLPGPGGRLPVRVYHPEDAMADLPCLVYLHGGGWVTGDLDSHDGPCRSLCARTPCVVVSVDYRRAPEHPYPAAVEDAWAATVWLAEHGASLGIDTARLAVGGDSAGGTLTAAVTFRARAHGLPLAFQLLVYPVCDRPGRAASYAENATGYGLTAAAMEWYWRQYLGDSGRDEEPEAAPLEQVDLAGLPSALVQTCGLDPLRDEGEAYAAGLAAAGVPTTLTRYDGMIHGVFRMRGVVPRSGALLDEAARALAAAFA